MRMLFASVALAAVMAMAACNPPATQAPPSSSAVGTAVGTLASAAGAKAAATIAKSKVGTDIASIACNAAAPVLDRYGATLYPPAAPFIGDAEAVVTSLCKGALPQGYNSSTAAAAINTMFAVVLGSGLMDL